MKRLRQFIREVRAWFKLDKAYAKKVVTGLSQKLGRWDFTWCEDCQMNHPVFRNLKYIEALEAIESNVLPSIKFGPARRKYAKILRELKADWHWQNHPVKEGEMQKIVDRIIEGKR